MAKAFELDDDVRLLIRHIGIPLMLVSGERVAMANAPAMDLLGDHIIGQDVRIAIRHPLAVSLLAGLSRSGAVSSLGQSP